MVEETQVPESDAPNGEQFRNYIRHRQLEMLSEDLWDEYLCGELGQRCAISRMRCGKSIGASRTDPMPVGVPPDVRGGRAQS